MGSAFGAGSGADMLQQILRQKFTEAIQQQRLAEDARQANMTNEIQRTLAGQGQQRIGLEGERVGLEGKRVGLEGRRVDLGEKEYTEGAPQRAASLAQTTAQTGELLRRPAAEEIARNFTHGENTARLGNALRIVGIQGQTARDVARIDHPLVGPSPQQQNEVADSIDLIDRMSQDAGLDPSVGQLDQYGAGYLTTDKNQVDNINRFKTLHDELVGKLQLAQAGKLKGQGAVSDAERAMLAKAATALSRSTNEKDYRSELGRIRQQFERLQTATGRPLTAEAVNSDPLGIRTPKK